MGFNLDFGECFDGFGFKDILSLGTCLGPNGAGFLMKYFMRGGGYCELEYLGQKAS